MQFKNGFLGLMGMVSVSFAATIYVSPTGAANAAGTIAAPLDLVSAIGKIAAGDTILMRAGTYAYNSQLTIAFGNNGSNGARKHLFAYANELPILDFDGQPVSATTSNNARGIQLEGNYWHLKGLDVRNSADNGIFVAGNNNIIEQCVIHGNNDSGLQISRRNSTLTNIADWPSYNLILNCESYDNYDAPPLGGENADGFAAKLTCGPGNVFRGCVAHHNIDDGWDLYTKVETGPIGTVSIDQCVAHHNGTLTSGLENVNGDKNGFKLGGSDMANRHVVTRSVAFVNGKNGFTWNSNPGELEMTNNLAWDNVEGNFNFGTNSISTQATFTNNISLWTTTSGTMSDKTIGTDVSNSNVWWNKSKTPMSQNGKGLLASTADFKNSLASLTLRRLANGDLDMSVFELAAGSDLLNAGVNPTVPLPYTGYYVGTPDLGAYETGSIAASSMVQVSSSANASSPIAVSSSAMAASSSGGAVLNTPPSVLFLSPTASASLPAPATLQVSVEATDANGSISNVKLFLDDVLVRQENGTPYLWNDQSQDVALQNMVAGTYTLKAIATDNAGAQSEASMQIIISSGTTALKIRLQAWQGSAKSALYDLKGRLR